MSRNKSRRKGKHRTQSASRNRRPASTPSLLTRCLISLKRRWYLVGGGIAAITLLSALGVQFVDMDPLISLRGSRFSLRVHLPHANISLPPEEHRDMLIALAASEVWRHADRCPISSYVPEIPMKVYLANTSDKPLTITRASLYFDTEPVTEYADNRLTYTQIQSVYLEPHQEITFDFKFTPNTISPPGSYLVKLKMPEFPPYDEPSYTPFSRFSNTGGIFPPLKQGGVIVDRQLQLAFIDSAGKAYRTVIEMGAAQQAYWFLSVAEVKKNQFERIRSDYQGGNAFWLLQPYRTHNKYWGTYRCE